MAQKDDKVQRGRGSSTAAFSMSFTEEFSRQRIGSQPLVSSASRPSFLKTGTHYEANREQRLKPMDLDVYWKEAQAVRESTVGSTSEGDDPEEDQQTIAARDPGCCGEEKDWLMQAGLDDVALQLQENQIVDIDNVKLEASKLNFTNLQTAAVVRRVTRANTAIKKWKARTHGADRQRDPSPSPPSPSDLSDARPPPDLSELGTTSPTGCELVLTPSSEFVDSEDGDFLIYGNESDAARDFVTLRQPPTGLSTIDDFSVDDCANLRRIVLIELTAVLDKFNISIRPMRFRKVKKNNAASEHAILGIPLTTLLERDRAVNPHVTIPIFITQIVEFLEQNGLYKEGLFRVPGNSAKLKRIREEMESSPISSFSWEGRGVNDAATLLKQFLRELPVPLLTFEYLHLFTIFESLKSRTLQLKVVNLLLILLPSVHREVLKRLLVLFNLVIDQEERNKMGVNNVAMIVAPNLFCKLEQATGSAEAEVKFAAGSSQSVRFLITFSPILFVIPGNLVKQLRNSNEGESKRLGKRPKSAKELQKLLKKDGKKDKSSNAYFSAEPKHGDVFDGPSNDQNDRCVIKVLSPEFPKVSMAMEVCEGMTSAGVLDQFIKRQAAYADVDSDDAIGTSTDELTAPGGVRGSSSISRVHSPRVSVSAPSDPRLYRARTGSVSVSDNVGSLYQHDDVDVDLYEVGGNISERRLRTDCEVMALRRVNPAAQWVIRKRPVRQV